MHHGEDGTPSCSRRARCLLPGGGEPILDRRRCISIWHENCRAARIVAEVRHRAPRHGVEKWIVLSPEVLGHLGPGLRAMALLS